MAALGYSVAVFEEHTRSGDPVCCTGIVGKECIERFSVGPEPLLREVKSATLVSPSGIALRAASGSTIAYILDRRRFDAYLCLRAQEAGADLLDGNTRTFQGKTVVIACGFHSRLSERVGLGRVPDFAAGAQREVDAKGIEELEVYFGRHVAPGFFGWLVPTSQGRARVGLLSRQHPGRYLRNLLSSLAREGKISASEEETSYGGVPLAPLPKAYRERVIVVGDAAGHVKPTTAGGIYYGLLCAEDAVETLHEALAVGDFRAATFANYETRWRRRLGGELRAGRWARRIFERCSDKRIDRGFRALESKDINGVLLNSPEFSFDWHRSLMFKTVRLVGLRGIIQILRPV
jgi:flavin-dependent dehydrogenase